MHAIADCAAIISLSENVPPSLSSSRFQNRYELNAPLQYYLPLRLPFHDCLIYMAFSPLHVLAVVLERYRTDISFLDVVYILLSAKQDIIDC